MYKRQALSTAPQSASAGALVTFFLAIDMYSLALLRRDKADVGIVCFKMLDKRLPVRPVCLISREGFLAELFKRPPIFLRHLVISGNLLAGHQGSFFLRDKPPALLAILHKP